MSEYQYYEFQALDRTLTQHDMRELRKYSTHATITADVLLLIEVSDSTLTFALPSGSQATPVIVRPNS